MHKEPVTYCFILNEILTRSFHMFTVLLALFKWRSILNSTAFVATYTILFGKDDETPHSGRKPNITINTSVT